MAIQILSHNTKLANKELLQKLIECALTCEECEAACLNEENITLLARCIELDRDCADICLQVQRDSEISEEYLMVCEKICRMCAEECNKHNHDHCKMCADACIACADACHAMVMGEEGS